jgi:hypothetical protein
MDGKPGKGNDRHAKAGMNKNLTAYYFSHALNVPNINKLAKRS